MNSRSLQTENVQLKARVQQLEQRIADLERQLSGTGRSRYEPPPDSGRPARSERIEEPADDNHEESAAFGDYQQFKQRLLADLRREPEFLQLVRKTPEIKVSIERETITMDGSSVQGRVAALIARNFFQEQKTFSAVRRELIRTGPDVHNKSLSQAFKSLVRMGFLTKEGAEGYKEVPGMRVRIAEK